MLGRFRRAWAAPQPDHHVLGRHRPPRSGRRRARRCACADAALYAAKAAGRDCDMLAAESAIEVVLP